MLISLPVFFSRCHFSCNCTFVSLNFYHSSLALLSTFLFSCLGFPVYWYLTTHSLMLPIWCTAGSIKYLFRHVYYIACLNTLCALPFRIFTPFHMLKFKSVRTFFGFAYFTLKVSTGNILCATQAKLVPFLQRDMITPLILPILAPVYTFRLWILLHPHMILAPIIPSFSFLIDLRISIYVLGGKTTGRSAGFEPASLLPLKGRASPQSHSPGAALFTVSPTCPLCWFVCIEYVGGTM